MKDWIFNTFFKEELILIARLRQEYERLRIENGELKRNWTGTEGDLAELRARRMGLWHVPTSS